MKSYNDEGYCAKINTSDYWFIYGKPGLNASIAENRLDHLKNLNTICPEPALKVSVRSKKTGSWTKWKLIDLYNQKFLETAFEIHRTILLNEIVIESDYSSYVENVKASKYLGQILESKGFIPHYYYGGNKSLHIHIFIDYDYLLSYNNLSSDKLKTMFKNQESFMFAFITWLREQMIVKWPFGEYVFDDNLIKNSHLIRSELSLNKLGYKTFLGYSYKDLKEEPYICNVQTSNYPEIASAFDCEGEVKHELKLSKPHNPEIYIEQFIEYYSEYLIQKHNKSLLYRNSYNSGELRKCVEFIYDDIFAESPDGYKRAMFILLNEFKRFYSSGEIKEKLMDWNIRMGDKVKESDIDARLKIQTTYKLTNEYIINFLTDLGFKKQEIYSFKPKNP